MPRYLYQCSDCNTEHLIMHSINDVVTDCTSCNKSGTMVKMLTSATYVNTKEENTSKVGQLTKEYIQTNKEILEEEKDKARKETYEPT